LKIVVDEKAVNFRLTNEILKRAHPSSIISLNGEKSHEGERQVDEPVVLITPYKGAFVKKCPGTKNYLCCGYIIFHFAENCPLGCSYCILQAYFNKPGFRIWANLIEDGLTSLHSFLKERAEKGELTRLGTGEFTDSLVFEALTGVARMLIEFWKETDPYAVLELKTKTAPSSAFYAKLPSDKRIIFAWSVNTERIIEKEEKHTASLKARFQSAEEALKHGFSLAFHFDPIILYEGGEAEYSKVLEEILNRFPLNRIAWISLGMLRFPPELKEVAPKNFPKTKVYADEFIRGLDQKYRYFIDRRIKAYKKILEPFKNYLNEIPIYFCMEGKRVWQEVLGKPFQTSEEVAKLLDSYAKRTCFS
jgi:spore photoproduct lyase